MFLGEGGDDPKTGVTDPVNNGQDLSTLPGKVLRIDINMPTVSYGIPHDNPFFGIEDVRVCYAIIAAIITTTDCYV